LRGDPVMIGSACCLLSFRSSAMLMDFRGCKQEQVVSCRDWSSCIHVSLGYNSMQHRNNMQVTMNRDCHITSRCLCCVMKCVGSIQRHVEQYYSLDTRHKTCSKSYPSIQAPLRFIASTLSTLEVVKSDKAVGETFLTPGARKVHI